MATHTGETHELAQLIGTLRADVVSVGEKLRHEVEAVPERRRPSAANMVHYAALRSADRRRLQLALASAGLSSLGRSEAHTLQTIEQVHDLLLMAAGLGGETEPLSEVSLERGHATLEANARALLGPARSGRRSRIMVTLAGENADEPGFFESLIHAGADVLRINCAHDTPDHWRSLIALSRGAAQRAGRICRILMDLPGPKVRTGAMRPGPQVLRWAPLRDAVGNIVRPARVLLYPRELGALAAGMARMQGLLPDAILPVSAGFLSTVSPGDLLDLRDHRGAEREMHLVRSVPQGIFAECRRTVYLTPGCVLTVRGRGRAESIGPLPATESCILLRVGETLVLTADASPGVPEIRDPEGVLLEPGRIPFSLPEVLADIRPGQRVMIDDGKAAAVVEGCDGARAVLRMTRVPGTGLKLRADKGINLPDTDMRIASMPAEDERHLGFIAANADMLGMSFARRREDVALLRQTLESLGASKLGVVLKVETRAAFDHLPELLLELMKFESCGVMIARGDLAVEMGWERLAEVQEEILWLCESAHMPVIWATQVLESLTKKGLASRGDITDAAAGQRAECVMLNKGPNIIDSVRALDAILRRMDDHQWKKRAMLRPLAMARRFVGEQIPASAARIEPTP